MPVRHDVTHSGKPAAQCRWLRPVVASCLAALALLSAAPPAWAQRIESVPQPLAEVGISEHPNAQLPLELGFVDSSGKPVKLGDYFDGRRPVLLTLNYSNCPMLCSLQLNGLLQGLSAMDWSLGDKYRVVTVSIDPAELPQRSEQTRQKYLKLYGRSGVAAGWQFLTGKEENIKRLASTVGFGYTYDAKTNQYAHAAATMVCTPEGRLSRYLYGVEYPPQTVRMALLEASQGKIGTTLDRVALYCFHYDPESGRYGPSAVRIMKLGGAATMLVLGGFLVLVWRRDTHKPKPAEGEAK